MAKKSNRTAKTSNRYELYEASVYDPDADLDFLLREFEARHGRMPTRLREDFAGTSKLSAIWVKSSEEMHAWAVDRDPEPLHWGGKRHINRLSDEQQNRIEQIEANVLDVETPAVDVLTAFNFSYWVFKERETLLSYFRIAFDALATDGMFCLDIMGGPEAQQEVEEPREMDGFDYIWEQEGMCPITHHAICHIRFDFPDGSKMKRAFTYDWRLWSLAEIRDIAIEAGFAEFEVFWEGATDEGEGDGNFTSMQNAEVEEAWIAYLCCWK